MLFRSPQGIVAAITSVNTSCGLSNGSVSVNVSGGAAPFSYLWSNASTATGIVGINAGLYTVTITDATGCSSQQTATVNASNAVVATSNSIPACGINNGNAVVIVQSGTGPYSYNWSPVQPDTSVLSGLSNGSYTCIITDANACKDTVTVNVVTYLPPTANAGADATINPNNTLQLIASGGNTYNWSPEIGRAHV